MKRSEGGFTLIELLLVVAIVALMAGAATMATFQVINVTKRSNNHMTAIRQVQNAGYWISHDALMAENVADNLTPPGFLTLTWTEWGYDEDKKGEETDTIYHSVTYSFQDLSDGIGKLRRTHWSRVGEDEQTLVAETLVAEYIYYNPDDPDDPDNPTASSDNSVLTMQITASLGEARETKEYTVWHRPNF